MSCAPCPATREAVEELEEAGHIGCLICGDPASYHDSEEPAPQEEGTG